MEHIDIKVVLSLVAITMTVLGGVIAGAIAWGRIKKTVEAHSKSIEGCSMDDLISESQCEDRRDEYADRVAAVLTRMDDNLKELKGEVKEDLQEIRKDIMKDRQYWNEYREKTAGSLGRVEMALTFLVNGAKKNA